MTDDELANALPQFMDGFQTLLTNRVTPEGSFDLTVYAAKMLHLYNWYTLYLGLFRSGGGSPTDLLRVIFGNDDTAGNFQRVRDMLTCGRTIHLLLNHCGFALLIRPGWFPFSRLMSKGFSSQERDHLICLDEVLVIERGIRASGRFNPQYAVLDTNVRTINNP